MKAYYNEIDPFASEWLRNLIAARHIAPGDVDERSIADVRPDDLDGYTQIHLFAGIGGWSLALRLAGWPDSEPVWTGSCPCQPFSAAGKRGGADDPRHLWPHMLRLIGECRPDRTLGEQVASAVGLGWLDGVCADLEGIGYSVGACVLGAHSVGAPHIRQRLWWVADARGQRRQQVPGSTPRDEAAHGGAGRDGCEQDCDYQPERACAVSGLADAERRERGQGRLCDGGRPAGAHGERAPEELAGSGGRGGLVYPERDGRGPDQPGRGQDRGAATRGAGASGGMGDACSAGLAGWPRERGDDGAQLATAERASGHWGDAWLPCSDGTARRAQPGISPLAHGIPRSVDDLRARMGRMDCCSSAANEPLRDARRFRKGVLKGAGNAIVPQVAAEFITVYMETRP